MYFPRTEEETISLCEQMIAGLSAHADDFTSITPVMLADLQGTLTQYQADKEAQDYVEAQTKIVTLQKEGRFDTVVALMKATLKRAEMDCENKPERLSNIGWCPRIVPAPTVPPYPGRMLKVTAQGPGNLWFEWEPIGVSSISHWVIERREQSAAGEFGPWASAGTAANTSCHLIDQPRGVGLEYRVKAVNAAGESQPSNSVSTVL